VDAAGNTTVSVYKDGEGGDYDYGLVTATVQPAVENNGSAANPLTTYSYGSDGDLTSETSPNGSTQTWSYTSDRSTYGPLPRPCV
jgi:YD repeat-containing protein